MNAGRAGVFAATLDVTGKNPYTETFGEIQWYSYRANTPILVPSWTRYVPVYERTLL